MVAESNGESIVMIELGRIVVDCQTRASIRPKVVDEYGEFLRQGKPLGHAIAYDDGHVLHAATFHHRLEAYRLAGLTKVPCVIRKGSRQDAILAGIADNKQHLGERLTREDRRHSVRLSLQEWPEWSDRRIAELVGVSDKTVAALRRELAATSEFPQSNVRVGQDGRRVDTANVGRKPATVIESCKSELAEMPLGITNGAKDDTESSEATEIEDRCICGGDWEKDGNGGRYCPDCGQDHPLTPSQPFDEEVKGRNKSEAGEAVDAQEGSQTKNAAPSADVGDKEIARFFRETYNHIGKVKNRLDTINHARPKQFYQLAMSSLNQASDAISAWVQSMGIESLVDTRGDYSW